MDKIRINHEALVDDVVFGFQEYIDEDGFTIAQASGKIIEESWKIINKSLFITDCYFINIAIESIKRGQIVDYIYNRVIEINVSEIINEELPLLLEDINQMKYMLKENKYEVIETSLADKSRIDYILSLDNN
ncbi:MAG: hypothetical protein ACK5LC_13055 [Coprobacillaceae bacterium]